MSLTVIKSNHYTSDMYSDSRIHRQNRIGGGFAEEENPLESGLAK